MFAIQVFVYLQLLDFLTTMIGLRVGAGEASPFVAKIMHATSPAMGVAASKAVGLGLGAICLLSHRARLISWINYWYAGVVAWNLTIIFVALSRHR